MVAVKAELEKELVNHYKNRFIVEGIIRGELPDVLRPASFYQEQVGSGKTPLVIIIKLHGQGERITQYQNAFGAQYMGVAPAVNVSLMEGSVDPVDGKQYSVDYGIKSYSSGSYAIGRNIYAAQNDPRKNTKNAVSGIFRDACKFDESINKYANPIGYEMEVNRFIVNFKAGRKSTKKLFGVASTTTELANKETTVTESASTLDYALTMRIDRFVSWCKSNSVRSAYLELLASFKTPQQKINYISKIIQMGIYKE